MDKYEQLLTEKIENAKRMLNNACINSLGLTTKFVIKNEIETYQDALNTYRNLQTEKKEKKRMKRLRKQDELISYLLRNALMPDEEFVSLDDVKNELGENFNVLCKVLKQNRFYTKNPSHGEIISHKFGNDRSNNRQWRTRVSLEHKALVISFFNYRGYITSDIYKLSDCGKTWSITGDDLK